MARSTATAFTLACARNPDAGAQQIAEEIRLRSRYATPNRRIVALADAYDALTTPRPYRAVETPEAARAIIDRMNSISFNATMMREMRAITLVTRLLEQHRLTGGQRHLQRSFLDLDLSPTLAAGFRLPGKQPLTEQVFYALLFDFLNALTKTGVAVYRDVLDNWVRTRRVWNQHTYHIGNVNDDGSVPRSEAPSWLGHNTYRLNLPTLLHSRQ